MRLDDITPLILSYNEAPNIARILDQLLWAKQIIVIDSGSDDATLKIIGDYINVKVIQRPFDQHSAQWNFGLSQVTTSWVLSLDADYVINQRFIAEINNLPESAAVAYRVGFRYLVFGEPLRGTLYPSRVILFRKDKCHYEQGGHTQVLRVDGEINDCNARIDHDDRKPLSRWLESQRLYAKLEAEYLLALQKGNLSWPDRLRLCIWPAVPAVFLYTLLVKCCIFDGWPGWYYALQRTYAELLLSLELLDRRLQNFKYQP